jgi:hypothetical protein
MDWARILAFVTGKVDQELLARNEYLAAENRILKAQLKGRLKLSDYVLFFIHLESRRVEIAGVTVQPPAPAACAGCGSNPARCAVRARAPWRS